MASLYLEKTLEFTKIGLPNSQKYLFLLTNPTEDLRSFRTSTLLQTQNKEMASLLVDCKLPAKCFSFGFYAPGNNDDVVRGDTL
jgi:hypothetical protein